MLSSAKKLAEAGADFLICPDNTIHGRSIWWRRARRCPGCTSPRWLRAEAPQRGFRRLGAHRHALDWWRVPVYPQVLRPTGSHVSDRMPMNERASTRIIMDELVNGVFASESRSTSSR